MPIGKTYRGVLDQSDSPELVLEIPSFAGGENTVGQDQELKVNEARTIENWDSDSLGGMIRSKGFTSIATSNSVGGIDSFAKVMLHLNNNITDSAITPNTFTNTGSVAFSNSSPAFTGTYYAIFNNGGTKQITAPTSTAFDLGTSNWTIEFRINWTSHLSDVVIFSHDTDANNYWQLSWSTTKGYYFQVVVGGSVTQRFKASATTTLSNGTWYHIVVERSGSSGLIFVNGVSQTITTDFALGTIAHQTGTLKLGFNTNIANDPNANIQEVRFSPGTARWTSSFTVPDAPYTLSNFPDGVLHHYEGSSTRNYVICNGNLNYINGTALTYTDLAAFTSGVLTHGVSAASKAWFTNATDNLKYTTIAGSITVPSSVPPSARSRVYYHKSRLIAEGGGVTVYGSRAGTGNWTAANAWSSSGDAWSIDLPDLTQGCAPGFPAGGQITVFTKFGAYALTNFPNVAQNYILGSHGCSQPESIQLGAEGIYLFSLYPTLGIFLWDGSSWVNLTVNETWVSQVSLTNRCFGIYSENKYRFFYNDNTSGATYPNVCRIYDARWGRWMKRSINPSVADTFGIPMLLTKANNELYVTSSQVDKVYQLEDTSTSDNTYDTQANYKTKDFTSKDFGMERDEVRMKLLKCTATYFGTTGNFTLQWSSDRGVHSGSITFDLQTTGDLLNTTFIINTSSVLSGSSIPDKTVTRSFNNSAIGSRFNFQIINNGTGERVKIKKIKIVAIALEER